MQARDQLGEAERLGQVVVGAQGKAVDDVVERARGREHEHLRLRLLGVERAAHVVAVQLGEVAVEDHHVVPVGAGLVQTVQAVGGHIDRHALVAQAVRDPIGQQRLVLDQQHPHPEPPTRSLAARALHPRYSRCDGTVAPALVHFSP